MFMEKGEGSRGGGEVGIRWGRGEGVCASFLSAFMFHVPLRVNAVL